MVLLHCLMGINRSATVAMAVLMKLEGWTLEEAYTHTHRCRRCVAPFAGNKRLIASWELEAFGRSSMPDWLPQRQSHHSHAVGRAAMPRLLDFDAKDQGSKVRLVRLTSKRHRAVEDESDAPEQQICARRLAF